MVLYLVSLLLYVSLLKPTVAMPGPMPGPKSDTEGYPYPEERGNDGMSVLQNADIISIISSVSIIISM